MGVFFSIAVLIVAGAMFIEGYNKHLYNKGWVNGVDYDGPPDSWVIGRVAADPNKEEFHIKLNSDDGHFYDRNYYGYHATEVYIKKTESGYPTTEIPKK